MTTVAGTVATAPLVVVRLIDVEDVWPEPMTTLDVALPPATMFADGHCSDTSTGGLTTLVVQVADAPPRLAGTVAVRVEFPGATPVTENVVDVLPAGMETVAGTVATAVLEELRVIVTDDDCAEPMNTVAVPVVPMTTSADGQASVTLAVGFATVVLHVAVFPPVAAGNVAVIVDVPAATPVIENVAEVCPAGMDTLAGTVAVDVFDDDSVTVIDDDCAGEIVTVDVPVVPATMFAPGQARVMVTTGLTVVVHEEAAPPRPLGIVAVMVDVPAAIAVTWNVAEVCPAGIDTFAGTVTTPVFEDARVMVVEDDWAVPIETVAVPVAPARMFAAGHDRETVTVGLTTVVVQFADDPPRPPGIVAVMVDVPAATPVTWNVAEVAPAGIDTLAGTAATAGFDDASVTVVDVA
jgi:hypothetical protein